METLPTLAYLLKLSNSDCRTQGVWCRAQTHIVLALGYGFSRETWLAFLQSQDWEVLMGRFYLSFFIPTALFPGGYSPSCVSALYCGPPAWPLLACVHVRPCLWFPVWPLIRRSSHPPPPRRPPPLQGCMASKFYYLPSHALASHSCLREFFLLSHKFLYGLWRMCTQYFMQHISVWQVFKISRPS